MIPIRSEAATRRPRIKSHAPLRGALAALGNLTRVPAARGTWSQPGRVCAPPFRPSREVLLRRHVVVRVCEECGASTRRPVRVDVRWFDVGAREDRVVTWWLCIGCADAVRGELESVSDRS